MNSPYLCSKCKRNHRPSSAIYKKHIKWQKIETDEIPCNKILSCNIKLLRGIAQKQIDYYLSKLLWDKRHNGYNKREMYIHQINKVILHETNNMLII